MASTNPRSQRAFANRIVIHDYTVDGYIAAIGRRLASHQFEHNTLRGGPLDLMLDLASVILNAMAAFIGNHVRRR